MKIHEYNEMMAWLTKPEPEPSIKQYLQGGRVGYQSGQLVQPGPGRQGYKGEKITFTPKEVKAINAELPNGINLQKRGNSFEWIATKTAGPRNRYWKSRAVTNKDPLKDKGLNLIKDEVNNFIETYLPNRITLEKYEQLRYFDDNINLTANDFAKKLESQGFTSMVEGKPITGKAVSEYDVDIGLRKRKSYSFKEQKDLVKNSLDKGEYDNIINLDISDAEKERRIRKRANIIRAHDKQLATLGTFAGEKTREARLFRNFYEAHSKGTRIEIGGNFGGKDLSKRKNWPRDAEDRVNWNLKGKNGQPAWKSVVFTDTQTPNGKVKFSFDNLKSQVDDAFGIGHFTRSTDAYAIQKEAYKNFGGADIAKQNIIKNYQKKYPGKIPTNDYIQVRMRAYAPGQVHHWAEGGIGADPYKVQFTSRLANQNLGYAERTYRASLRAAGGDPIKIKEAENIFKNEIKKISKEMGGIQYHVAGQLVGDVPTAKSVYQTEKSAVKLIQNQLNESVVNFAKKIEGTPAAKQLGLKLAKKNAGKFMSRAIALGLGGELAAELAFAMPGYAAGKTGSELLGESIFGIFGAGTTFNEELAKYADPKAKEIIDLKEDMLKLQRQASTIGASEAGLEGETELQERMMPKLIKGMESYSDRKHILEDQVYGASYLKALKAKRMAEEERAKSLPRKAMSKVVEAIKTPFIEGIKDVGYGPGLFKSGGKVDYDNYLPGIDDDK